jgi:cobalt-zinc-cadmium efflux system protein
MQQDQAHGCDGDARRAGRRGLAAALVLTATLTVVELVGSWLTGSLALLSDAGHMLTDTLALGLSLAALRFSSAPATPRKTFGFHRLEILAALCNAVTLILLALYIFWEAVARLRSPPELRTGLMLAVATVGLVVNAVSARLLHAGSTRSLNERGAFLHVMGDLLSSAAVVAAAILIRLSGWTILDPLLGLGIGVVIVVGALRLLKESVDVLLEAVPAGMDLEDVRAALGTLDTVRDVHDLHVWSLTSGVHALSAHLAIDNQSTAQSDRILEAAATLLRERFGIAHCTLQIEHAPGAGCGCCAVADGGRPTG